MFTAFSRWAFIGSSLWKCVVRTPKKGFFCPLSIIEGTGGDNSTSIFTCVLYFSCCIKITSLSATAYSAICLEKIGQTLKKIVFIWVDQIVMIH